MQFVIKNGSRYFQIIRHLGTYLFSNIITFYALQYVRINMALTHLLLLT